MPDIDDKDEKVSIISVGSESDTISETSHDTSLQKSAGSPMSISSDGSDLPDYDVVVPSSNVTNVSIITGAGGCSSDPQDSCFQLI